MPEGPEIKYTSLLLNKRIKGFEITDINSYTAKPVVIPKNFDNFVEDVDCYGKLFWIKTPSHYIDIHYGISGWFQFEKPEKNIKYDFEFTNKKNDRVINLYMEDRRRFSKIQIHTEKEHNLLIDKLGVDILDPNKFTLEYFLQTIKSKKSLLLSTLLKQEYFAGLGNYIKNEAVYLSNIDVYSKTNELTDAEITKLYKNILFVSYSSLLTLLTETTNMTNITNNITKNIKIKLEIPYNYRIYGQTKTVDNKKVYKKKIGGRDTYMITIPK
jgi:formamidopyrimidine-DNA glycosylase